MGAAARGEAMLLIVVGTFVATFLVVCVTAYFLLSRRNAEPDGALQSLPRADNTPAGAGRRQRGVAVPDDEVSKLTIQEKVASTAQWLRHLTGADKTPANALPPNAHGAPGIGFKVLLVCVMLVAAVAIFFGVIAGMNQLFAWFVEPVIGWVFQLVFPLLLTLEGSLLVAGGILVLGLPLARRFRRPERFRSGVILFALAPATLWPLQYAAGSVDLGFWEYTAFLRVVAFLISATLFAAGLETMRRATNTPEDDSWEF